MTVPAVHPISSGNVQLRGIQARGLSAPDEAAFKSALTAEYLAAMQAATIHAPPTASLYRVELLALQSLTNAQLAALAVRL